MYPYVIKNQISFIMELRCDIVLFVVRKIVRFHGSIMPRNSLQTHGEGRSS